MGKAQKLSILVDGERADLQGNFVRGRPVGEISVTYKGESFTVQSPFNENGESAEDSVKPEEPSRVEEEKSQVVEDFKDEAPTADE